MTIRPELCRSCEAPIFWATTPDGKLMPVNLEEDPHGNVIIGSETTAHGGPVIDRVLGSGTDSFLFDGERRFTSHFATCPDSAKWRKD